MAVRRSPDFILSPASRRLRLQTLVRLRWLAIIGQSGAVLWGWYAALTVLAVACAYVFSLVGSGVVPSLLATGLEIVATAALYPVAHQLIDRFEDADVRFR